MTKTLKTLLAGAALLAPALALGGAPASAQQRLNEGAQIYDGVQRPGEPASYGQRGQTDDPLQDATVVPTTRDPGMPAQPDRAARNQGANDAPLQFTPVPMLRTGRPANPDAAASQTGSDSSN